MSQTDKVEKKEADLLPQYPQEAPEEVAKFLKLKYFQKVEENVQLKFQNAADGSTMSGLLKTAKYTDAQYHKRQNQEDLLYGTIISPPKKLGGGLSAAAWKWLAIVAIVIVPFAFLQSNPKYATILETYIASYGNHILIAAVFITIAIAIIVSKRRTKRTEI